MSEGTAHEVVVSSLMDLQARLRGDGDEQTPAKTATQTEAPAAEMLSVVEDDLTVQVEAVPTEEEGYVAPVTPLHPAATADDARLAALTARLERLEAELDGVIDRIQKVDPERLDRLEAVHAELGVQHQGLTAAIDSHFTQLQASIDERLRGSE